MISEKKKELELIKNRLTNAYSMTIEEQKKWIRKIKELEVNAAMLEKAIGEAFSDKEGINLLITANHELSRELSEHRWGKGMSEYLDENPKVNELLNKACEDVDKAFNIKSMIVLKIKIENYKKVFKFVEKTYADIKIKGFRELTPDENKKADKDLEQIGWL